MNNLLKCKNQLHTHRIILIKYNIIACTFVQLCVSSKFIACVLACALRVSTSVIFMVLGTLKMFSFIVF